MILPADRPMNRRAMLRTTLGGSSLIALSPTIPGFLASTARAAVPHRDGRVLVVVELNGGNDGINTVVPFADEGYAKHRKTLRLDKDRLVKVNDHVGLHPSLQGFGKLLEAGQLVIAQGVSYPNPSRSHFQSMATWHTARLDPEEHQGTRVARPRPRRGWRDGLLAACRLGPATGRHSGPAICRLGHRADRGLHHGRGLRPAQSPRQHTNGR